MNHPLEGHSMKHCTNTIELNWIDLSPSENCGGVLKDLFQSQHRSYYHDKAHTIHKGDLTTLWHFENGGCRLLTHTYVCSYGHLCSNMHLATNTVCSLIAFFPLVMSREWHYSMPAPPPLHTHLSLFHFLPVAGFDMSIFHQCLCTRHSWVSSKYNMTKFITFRPWIVFRDSLSVSSCWDKVLLDTPEPFLCENKLKKHFVRVSRDSVLPLLHAITPPFSCPTVVSHTPLLSLNASVSLFCCGPVLWLK